MGISFVEQGRYDANSSPSPSPSPFLDVLRNEINEKKKDKLAHFCDRLAHAETCAEAHDRPFCWLVDVYIEQGCYRYHTSQSVHPIHAWLTDMVLDAQLSSQV